MKILNLDPVNYSPKARRVLESVGDVTEREMTRDGLLEAIGDVDVLVLRFAHRIDSEIIARGRRLKVIATNTTGLDHIDTEAAARRNVTIVSLKGETSFLTDVSATAEHTWALLLALHRRLVPASLSVKAGEWQRDRFVGSELRGKRLGIVGLGRIGKMVARYGLAFGMATAAFDIDPDARLDGVALMPDLESLVSQSDVLSIHVPATTRTRHLIGGRELALLPPGSVLVNTSRGSVVDETALVAALELGTLRAGAVDVLTDEHHEGFSARNVLIGYARDHDTLLITPHIGGATVESWEKTEIFIAEKIRRHFLRPMGDGAGN